MDGERDLGAAASDLGVDGFPVARATAFLAPLQGLGRCLGDVELRLGRVYRLLCPPTLAREVEHVARNPGARLLAAIDGWPVLELDLSEGDGSADEMGRALESVGLGLRQSGLRVDLVGVPATGHRVLPSGSSCEVFDVARPPVIAVASSLPLPSAEAHLLVVDASGSRQLSLSSGKQWRIRVEDPAPGLVVVEARRRDRDSEHDQVAFWLEDSPLPATAPPATLRVSVQGNEVPEGGRRCLDLAAACGAQAALNVEAPPAWPVTLRWGEGPFASGVVTVAASDDGSVPLANVRTVLATFFEKHRLAWLDIEACELPNRRLLHERRLALDEATTAIRALATHADVEAVTWLPVPERVERWIQPVLAQVGYEIEPLPNAAVPCACWRVLRRRLAGGFVECSSIGVLGVAAHAPGLDDPLLRELAEDIRGDGLDLVILTDGEQWIVHWPSRPFSRAALIDLRAALDAVTDNALAAAICGLVS